MRFAHHAVWLSALASVNAVDPLVDLGYAKYQGSTLGNNVNQWLSLRFAAPVTGKNRFSIAQQPANETEVQDATKEGALCLSANNQEGLQYNSPRQPMAEDCLFLGLYAPLNATVESKLPIMFFIQGGGFSSNSNGNYNGSTLVEASGMNMIVVRINYRVGILGFIGGSAISSDKNGAVPNNGLNDMVAAARWVKEHATKFGGDPDHIVLSGDSSGGNAIDILLTANNGTGFPDLFIGAAAESTGWGSDPYAVDRDSQLTEAIRGTGCSNATDPIDCMRTMPIAEFQTKLPQGGWGPTIDGKMLVAPHYQMMEKGLFQKIPVIYGTASNEGTPDFISNQSASTEADIEKQIRNQVGRITDTEVASMLTAYPESLKDTSFLGRDVSVASSANASLRKGSGEQWQRDATVMTELKLTCVASFFSDMHAMVGNTQNFHYRYNVLDTTPGGKREQGLFTEHTSELYAIWGLSMTDGGDPKCFSDTAAGNSSCVTGGKMTQAYWISFVRSLSPNTFKLAGSPDWETWTIEGPKRIVLDNTAASMEVMGQAAGEVTIAGMNQRQRCNTLTLPLAKAMNAGLKQGETLLPFANGTSSDPTLTAVGAAVNVGSLLRNKKTCRRCGKSRAKQGS